MRNTIFLAVLAAASIGYIVGQFQPAALAHCQIPCGIYGDKLRIDLMMEDAATIEKYALHNGTAQFAVYHDARLGASFGPTDLSLAFDTSFCFNEVYDIPGDASALAGVGTEVFNGTLCMGCVFAVDEIEVFAV